MDDPSKCIYCTYLICMCMNPAFPSSFVHKLVKMLSFPSFQWMYNLLEHKAEVERIIFEDPDPEIGFVNLSGLSETIFFTPFHFQALFLHQIWNGTEVWWTHSMSLPSFTNTELCPSGTIQRSPANIFFGGGRGGVPHTMVVWLCRSTSFCCTQFVPGSIRPRYTSGQNAPGHIEVGTKYFLLHKLKASFWLETSTIFGFQRTIFLVHCVLSKRKFRQKIISLYRYLPSTIYCMYTSRVGGKNEVDPAGRHFFVKISSEILDGVGNSGHRYNFRPRYATPAGWKIRISGW